MSSFQLNTRVDGVPRDAFTKRIPMAHALVVDADLEIQRCLSEIVRGEGMTLSLADSVRKGRI
jgi:hypothetical protein